MRKNNPNKLQAIKKSVIDLCQNYGLLNMTTAKIAHHAGVSPATIYLHYQDKTDLLSRLYEEVKLKLQEGIDQVIDNHDNLDHQIQKVLNFSIQQCLKYPDEVNFIQMLWNNRSLLNQHALDFDRHLNPALLQLLKNIESSNKYVNVSQTTLNVFFSIPILVLENNQHLNHEELKQVTQMIINAIKK